MKQAWQDYEKAAERGPMAIAVKVILAVFALGIFVSVIGYGLGWFGEAAQEMVSSRVVKIHQLLSSERGFYFENRRIEN